MSPQSPDPPSTVGNLDKRGTGYVKTLTVEEYQKMTKSQRFWYRVYLHPIILLIVPPFFLFTILFRFTQSTRSKKEKIYTHLSTLSIIGIITGISFWIGLLPDSFTVRLF